MFKVYDETGAFFSKHETEEQAENMALLINGHFEETADDWNVLEKAHKELVRYARIVTDYDYKSKGDFHRLTLFEAENKERFFVRMKNGEVISINKAY